MTYRKVKFILSLLTAVLIVWNVNAQSLHRQKVDSLWYLVNTLHDSDLFDIYIQLVSKYESIDLDSSRYCLEKAWIYAKKYDNLSQQAKVMLDYGQLASYESDYKKALKNYIQAFELYKKASDFKEMTNVYHEIGNLFWTQNNYLKAAEYYLKELSCSEKHNDLEGMARALLSIAFIYGESAEYDEELKFYKKALEIWKKIDDKHGINVTLVNIGNVYKEKHNIKLALQYYYHAFSYRQYENPRSLDILLYNFGDIYLEMDNIDSSAHYFYKALYNAQKFKNNYTLAYIHHGLARLYKKKSIPDSVYQHLTLALKSAWISGTPECRALIFKEFADYFAEKKNFKEAYRYERKTAELNDSMSVNEARQKIAAYEVEKVKSKLKMLEKETEIASLKTTKSRNQRNFLALVSLLTLLLLAFIFARYRFRRKTNLILEQKNAELETANNTKDKFFAIVAHDLKNHLVAFQNISQNLSENYEHLDDSRKQHLTTRLWHSSQTLYGMLENLLTWSLSQLNRIDFNPENTDVYSIANKVISELQLIASRKSIQINNNIKPDTLIYADINMIYTVLRNLIVNAIKFSPEHSVILLNSQFSNETILICIKDQGIGIHSDDLEKLFRIDVDHKTIGSSREKGTGLGLILCKEFVTKHHGKIWVESRENEGSIFCFSIPLKDENGKRNN